MKKVMHLMVHLIGGFWPRTVLVGAILTTGAALLGSGTAHASPEGDLASANAIAQFMSDLTKAGFQNPYGPKQQLADGIHTCLNIDHGSTAMEQARLIWTYGYFTQYGAGQFVDLAIRDLCPWNVPATTTIPGSVGNPVAWDTKGGCYENSSHDCVKSPTREPYRYRPPGATAQCGDGNWSFGEHPGGICSGHGGVA
jgi:Protein of unknown function (DUF3761)/Protein of unknown function (DUF732)